MNRYSLFESLEDKLVPQTRVEILFDLALDNQVIWLAADDCRVISTKMQLVVPQITFNSDGQRLYASNYLKPQKWTYLKETVSRSNSTQNQTGNYVINSGETKPRHVFVFFTTDANIDEQTANPFLYNTFSVSTNQRTLSDCFLEVSNGVEYPDRHYEPDTDLTRVYRDILKYVHANNEYSQGTLLNRSNFLSLYQFLYFDLTKQCADLKDSTIKPFHYKLSGATATAFSIYALALGEQDVEFIQKDGKLLFR